MITPKDIKQYKYLVIKVSTVENDSTTTLYKYSHIVRGVDCEYILGFYDEANEKHPVELLTNKNATEYDWGSFIARIKLSNPKYLDKFEHIDKMIVVTDQITKNEPFMNFNNANCAVQLCNETVYQELKDENTIKRPEPEKEKKTTEEIKKRETTWKKLMEEDHKVNSTGPKIMFTDELKKRIKKPGKFDNIGCLSVFLIITFIAFIAFMVFMAVSSTNPEQPAVVENMTVTTSVKRHVEVNPDSIDEVNRIQDSIKVYSFWLEDSIKRHTADSIAELVTREQFRRDSIAAELRAKRKVSVTLAATLEDGITTREVHANVTLDTIKDSDMETLTKVINEMATNMAHDRQAEIDTTKNYYGKPIRQHDGVNVIF